MSFALVIVHPAEQGVVDLRRMVRDAAAAAVDTPRDLFVNSPVAGILATVDRVVPVLPVDGVDIRLDPDDHENLNRIVDWLFRIGGVERRDYLATLIEGRRAALSSTSATSPPSEPGYPFPRPASEPARASELSELARLASAAALEWDRLYARLGAILEFVDVSARNVLTTEINEARELASYAKCGLQLCNDGTVAIADQALFGRFAAAMRSLARKRAEIRAAETDETVASGILFGAMLVALMELARGSSPVPLDDLGVAQASGIQRDAERRRIAALRAYAEEMQALALQFPLAWRLDDDVGSDAADTAIKEWAGEELGRTHAALDEIYEGAVLRDPPVFTTADPLAAVVADAMSTWSVWQYPQVVSLGLAKARLVPGSLAWCGAMEALRLISAEREPREEDGGWLFSAGMGVAVLIPVVREVVAVIGLLVAALRALDQISEAVHRRTAHLAALDPVSALAVPDMPLAGVVISSVVSVGLSVYAAWGPMKELVDRALYACRRAVVGASIMNDLTLGGFGASKAAITAHRPVAALVESSQRANVAQIRTVLREVRASAEAAGSVSASTAQAAARVVVDEEAGRLIAALTQLAATTSSTGSTAQQGASTATTPPSSGGTSSTTRKRPPIPDIEELLASETLLASVTANLVALARTVAPSLTTYLAENPSLARSATILILSAPRAYTGTYTLRRQIAEGMTLEEAQLLDVNGIVNYGGGKVNELLAGSFEGLRSRLFDEANARWAAAPPGTWERPGMASQVEIDRGKGFKLAQDLVMFSVGRGPNQGLVRLWALGQITFGDPLHLLEQTSSDLARLGTPRARMRIGGVVYDIGTQVIGGPPLPGTLPAANTAILGAATRPAGEQVAEGLGELGVSYIQLPWSANELRTLVREVLRRAGRLGQ